MAFATKRVKAVQNVEYKPNGVSLDLTHEEARVLKIILSKVGGNPGQTLRGYSTNISNALEDAGYMFSSRDVDTLDGSVYFRIGELLDMEPTEQTAEMPW